MQGRQKEAVLASYDHKREAKEAVMASPDHERRQKEAVLASQRLGKKQRGCPSLPETRRRSKKKSFFSLPEREEGAKEAVLASQSKEQRNPLSEAPVNSTFGNGDSVGRAFGCLKAAIYLRTHLFSGF